MPAPRHSRRFYALATLSYLAVIAALLALAVFGRGATERLGDARVRVRYAALPLFGRSVAKAVVTYHGLSLSFVPVADRDRAAGSTAAASVLRSHGEGIDLDLAGWPSLELRDAGDGSLAIAIDADGQRPVLVPARVPGGLRQPADEPMLSWRRGGRSWYLALPPGSRVDEASGTLEIAPAAGAAVRVGPLAGGERDLASRWLADPSALVDEPAWRAAVTAFADAAWEGWSRTRLSADRATWRGADGSFRYDERAATALLAEGLARGAYPAQRVLVGAAWTAALRAAPATAPDALPSAYVGNLRERSRRVLAAEAPAIERIRSLLASRDPGLFLEPGLVPYVLDHGPFNLVQEIVTLAGTLRAGSLEPAVATGVLEAYLDYDRHAASGGAMAARAREVVRSRLLAAIINTDRGLFLGTGAGTVDTAASIRCGAVLVRAGEGLAEPTWVAVGRSLVASALALHGAEGFLPARLEVSDGVATPLDDAGVVAPEAVYALVAVDRRLPREIPLHLAVGPGTWLWTAAELAAVQGTPTGLRLELAFPAGQAHYLAIDGLRSVGGVELHGTAWRPAADYAQYGDGWTWDATTGQLHLKLTGRADTETVVVTY